MNDVWIYRRENSDERKNWKKKVKRKEIKKKKENIRAKN